MSNLDDRKIMRVTVTLVYDVRYRSTRDLRRAIQDLKKLGTIETEAGNWATRRTRSRHPLVTTQSGHPL